MPRIPKQPDCGCHIPVGASEDIKLKIMEEKLKEQLKAEIPGILSIEKAPEQPDPDVFTRYIIKKGRKKLYKSLGKTEWKKYINTL